MERYEVNQEQDQNQETRSKSFMAIRRQAVDALLKSEQKPYGNCAALLYLYSLTQHSDYTIDRKWSNRAAIKLRQGQFYFTLRQLRDVYGWGHIRIREWINNLEQTGQLTTIAKYNGNQIDYYIGTLTTYNNVFNSSPYDMWEPPLHGQFPTVETQFPTVETQLSTVESQFPTVDRVFETHNKEEQRETNKQSLYKEGDAFSSSVGNDFSSLCDFPCQDAENTLMASAVRYYKDAYSRIFQKEAPQEKLKCYPALLYGLAYEEIARVIEEQLSDVRGRIKYIKYGKLPSLETLLKKVHVSVSANDIGIEYYPLENGMWEKCQNELRRLYENILYDMTGKRVEEHNSGRLVADVDHLLIPLKRLGYGLLDIARHLKEAIINHIRQYEHFEPCMFRSIDKTLQPLIDSNEINTHSVAVGYATKETIDSLNGGTIDPNAYNQLADMSPEEVNTMNKDEFKGLFADGATYLATMDAVRKEWARRKTAKQAA